MKRISFLLFSTLLFSFGCKTSQQLVEEPIIDATITEFRELDTMFVLADKPSEKKAPEEYSLPVHKPSYRLINDLIHTKLEVEFDWTKERVIGKAELTLKPWFDPTDKLELDAKNFDIKKIMLATGEELKYEYDGKKIQIQLNREYKKTENYNFLSIRMVVTKTSHSKYGHKEKQKIILAGFQPLINLMSERPKRFTLRYKINSKPFPMGY